jgi:lipid-binding SYLF domain-containing protein
MKQFVTSLLLLSVIGPALGANRGDLDYRIRELTWKLQAMQDKPDKGIPAEALRKAQGIILLDRTKAGFLFAYQGGAGVAMVRDSQSGHWSAPAFLKANEASLGLQIGGQQSFVVILLMNTNAFGLLDQPNFRFGGEARGTAGNATGGVEGSIATTEPLVLAFSDREGLFGGAAIKGDSLSPDTDADIAYYNSYFSTRDILFEHKAQPGAAATELAQKIDQFQKNK